MLTSTGMLTTLAFALAAFFAGVFAPADAQTTGASTTAGGATTGTTGFDLCPLQGVTPLVSSGPDLPFHLDSVPCIATGETDGVVYFLGGNLGRGGAPIVRVDFQSNTSEEVSATLASGPTVAVTPFIYGQCGGYQGKVVMISGQFNYQNTALINTSYVYDTSTNTLTQKFFSLPNGGFTSSAQAMMGPVLFMAYPLYGANFPNFSPENGAFFSYSFDTDQFLDFTNNATGDRPSRRFGATLVPLNEMGTFLFFGGATIDGDATIGFSIAYRNLTDVYKFVVAADGTSLDSTRITATTLAPPSFLRSAVNFFSARTNSVFYGTMEAEGIYANLVWGSFNLDTKAWEKAPFCEPVLLEATFQLAPEWLSNSNSGVASNPVMIGGSPAIPWQTSTRT